MKKIIYGILILTLVGCDEIRTTAEVKVLIAKERRVTIGTNVPEFMYGFSDGSYITLDGIAYNELFKIGNTLLIERENGIVIKVEKLKQ